MVKNPPAIWETWVGKIPWKRARQPTPEFLPGDSPWTRGAWQATVHRVAILKSGASLQKALNKVAFLQSKGVVGYNKKKRINSRVPGYKH